MLCLPSQPNPSHPSAACIAGVLDMPLPYPGAGFKVLDVPADMFPDPKSIQVWVGLGSGAL